MHWLDALALICNDGAAPHAHNIIDSTASNSNNSIKTIDSTASNSNNSIKTIDSTASNSNKQQLIVLPVIVNNSIKTIDSI